MAPRTRKPSTPEQNRRANLWRLYKIRPDEYDALRQRQGFRCAICARHESELPAQRGGRPRGDGVAPTGASLVVDHDHETGAIRGLLCQPCNTAIGMLEDCPERLRGALRYLGKTGAAA